jgi:hypothetical protein
MYYYKEAWDAEKTYQANQPNNVVPLSRPVSVTSRLRLADPIGPSHVSWLAASLVQPHKAIKPALP